MHPSLIPRWQKAETLKEDYLRLFSGYSATQLSYHPGEKEWNMLGVAHHLIKAEKGTVKYIKHKLSQQKSLNPGWDHFFKIWGLKIALWLPVKYKAPAGEIFPDDNLSLAMISEEWTGVRAEMKELLENFPKEFLEKKMFKHPLAGPMDIGQALLFWKYHLTHHLQQINRIKSAEGFPTPKGS